MELDPSQPYPLGNFFECTIMQQEGSGALTTLRPLIRAAIQRCREQADVKMNLPWAFFDMGRFKMLVGEPEASLVAVAKGVELANHGWMVRAALQSVENIWAVRNEVSGFEEVRQLLTLGWAARFPSWDSLSRLRALGTQDRPLIPEPVLILAGEGSELGKTIGQQAQAIAGWQGTIVSGGTMSGLGGLVGELQTRHPHRLKTLGHLPRKLPKGVQPDRRYWRLVRTEGEDFSAREPLRYWADILLSGIRPYRVRLLGIGGGAVAGLEYRIALALGAHVGIVEGSGRAADELLADRDWRDSALLKRVGPDAKAIRAFLAEPGGGLDSRQLNYLARAIHDAYRAERRSEAIGKPEQLRALERDPAMADWAGLARAFRQSSRLQAEDTIPKLWRIGLKVVPTQARPIVPLRLTQGEVELLAELEHNRWNAERFFAGWTRGDKRDKERKITPYLVDWSDLPESVRDYDRQTVRKIPELLAAIGLEIQRVGR